MRLQDLIETLSKKHDVPKKDLKLISEDIFDAIREALAEGDNVTIHGFGTFTRGTRAPRIRRNPRTGETLMTKEKHFAKFKPGKAFRDLLGS